MRTKTLLLTAAVLTAGLAASVAQSVYSVNAVGYVNKSLAGNGYTLVSNPLNGTNNLLSTILPVVPDGTFVLKWNATAQTFEDPYTYVNGIGWLPDGTLNPGEGAFINNPSAATTVTFVGEVPQGNLTNQISGNYSLLAHIVPQSISLANPSVNLPVQDGDFVLFWDTVTQGFGDPITYVNGLGWLPNEPVPAVAEGFFYNTGAGASRSWGRSFSVN